MHLCYVALPCLRDRGDRGGGRWEAFGIEEKEEAAGGKLGECLLLKMFEIFKNTFK